jgi:predicted nucleic acid-binding protein
MYLLDTNVLSELSKPRPDLDVSRRIHGTEKERLFASEMSRYEIRFGAILHPRSDEFWEKALRKLIPIPVWLPVDGEVSLATAELDAELRRRGTPIGLVDTFLAATALTFQLVMVTRNVRHFGRVPGLTIENWFPEGSGQP